MELAEIVTFALEDKINRNFCISILIIVGTGLLLSLIDKLDNFRKFLPNFSVSIGIFGTFLGIFIGLSGFNTHNISASIPELLNGMKLAFFSSLIGLLGAFILQIMYNLMDDKRSKGSSDPIKSLQNIESSSITVEQSIKELEKTIKSCFKSEEEYSLVSQVKLIRQELIDSRKETKQAFQEFAEQFSKMASESIIDELQKVIDKFNVMLNDLVAQSFNELRESTENLNKWQNDYKITIENTNINLENNFNELKEQHVLFREALKAINDLTQKIGNSKNSFDLIEKSLKKISTSGEELSFHSKNLVEQNEILKTSISEIKDIGSEAKKVIPEINSKINEIINSITKLHDTTNSTISETTKKLSSFVEETSNSILSNSEKLSKNIYENVDKINTASTAQIEALEKSLENELKKSLDSLVGALASLSSKFVEDYTPLTNRLRDVVRIAEKV